MKSRNFRPGWGAIAYLLALYFFIPIFLSKVALGASWKAVAIAYGLWFGLLFLWGATSKGTQTEKTGWPIVMGMFFTIPAVLVTVLLLREVGGIQ